MTNLVLSPSVPADDDHTRVGTQQHPTARPNLPTGMVPPTRRRIRPVPPGPSVGFVPLPLSVTPRTATALGRPAFRDGWADHDDWDRRADRLQWWMADLSGPHPVTVETTDHALDASRTLENGLRNFGVDVIEANASLLKGLLPMPPQNALVRFLRWLTRSRQARLEVVEVRLDDMGERCQVSARASGERSAEALRVALSDLPPAPR